MSDENFCPGLPKLWKWGSLDVKMVRIFWFNDFFDLRNSETIVASSKLRIVCNHITNISNLEKRYISITYHYMSTMKIKSGILIQKLFPLLDLIICSHENAICFVHCKILANLDLKFLGSKFEQQLLFKRHWQLIWSKLGFYFSSGITLDIDVFFLWRTSYWSIEDKTYKKVERNPF